MTKMLYDVLGNTEDDYEKVEPNSERWLDLTDLSNEVWKDIKDFEGLYQISTYGRVKSLDRYKQHYTKKVYVPSIIRKADDDKDGYQIMPLNKNGKKYMKKVHRLVAEAFIPNPENKLLIDHIDCNPKNNIVINLRWATAKENVKHAVELGRAYHPTRGKRRGENPQSIPIIQKDKNGNFIKIWDCAEDVADCLGVNRRTIGSCCRGEKLYCKGFRFEYVKR